MSYPNIVGAFKTSLYNSYVAPAKQAVTAGNKEGLKDAVGPKSIISGLASGGISAAASKVKTPQQALAAVGGFALGVTTSYVTGFVSGFGKSLGWWGK